MNKETHTFALEALDKAVNVLPGQLAILDRVKLLRKSVVFGTLIRNIYDLIPDEGKPIMDYYFFFSYTDKSLAKNRCDFAGMFEERLYSGIGINGIYFYFEDLSRYGIADKESLSRFFDKLNQSWRGILSIRFRDFDKEGKKVFVSINPVNPNKVRSV